MSQPSDVVVMENFVRADTTGTMEDIDAKYELLKRGQYTLNVGASQLTPLTSDLSVPLQLREARQTMAVAKAQGADHYAADTMQKAAVDMQNADGYYHTKNISSSTRWRERRPKWPKTRVASAYRKNAKKRNRQLATPPHNAKRSRSARRPKKPSGHPWNPNERPWRTHRRAQAESDTADRRNSKITMRIAMVNAGRAEIESRCRPATGLDKTRRLAQEKALAISGRDLRPKKMHRPCPTFERPAERDPRQRVRRGLIVKYRATYLSISTSCP